MCAFVCIAHAWIRGLSQQASPSAARGPKVPTPPRASPRKGKQVLGGRSPILRSQSATVSSSVFEKAEVTKVITNDLGAAERGTLSIQGGPGLGDEDDLFASRDPIEGTRPSRRFCPTRASPTKQEVQSSHYGLKGRGASGASIGSQWNLQLQSANPWPSVARDML
eukprot:s2009_g8.t1